MEFKYLDEYLKNAVARQPYRGALADAAEWNDYAKKHACGTPYCGAIVSMADKTVYSGFYSKKNERGEAFTEHTPLYIYSMTKTLTTLCGMLLVERGLMHLHDELALYLPEFRHMRLRDGSSAKNPILIDHLFSMRAGFDYELCAPEIEEIQRDHEFRTCDIVKALSKRPLLFEPGTAWRYSLCHDVLGALIEKISGVSLGEFMTENIFKPLGMTETTFHPTAKTIEEMGDLFVYENGKCTKREKLCDYRLKSSLYESGGAGLVSTAHDLSVYARAVATGKLLSRFAVDAWRAPVCTLDGFETGAWFKPGYLYGRGVRVMVEPALAGCIGSKGEFGWDGAAGSWIMFDPENELSAVFTQHVLGIGADTFAVHIRNMIYAEAGRK